MTLAHPALANHLVFFNLSIIYVSLYIYINSCVTFALPAAHKHMCCKLSCTRS